MSACWLILLSYLTLVLAATACPAVGHRAALVVVRHQFRADGKTPSNDSKGQDEGENEGGTSSYDLEQP